MREYRTMKELFSLDRQWSQLKCLKRPGRRCGIGPRMTPVHPRFPRAPGREVHLLEQKSPHQWDLVLDFGYGIFAQTGNFETWAC